MLTNLAGVSLPNISGNKETCAVLQTAQLRAVGTNGILHVAKFMSDSGSDRSYVRSRLVKKCKPIWNCGILANSFHIQHVEVIIIHM